LSSAGTIRYVFGVVRLLIPHLAYCGVKYGGKYVINPSGGLEAKGHPLGATGLAMHFSITSMSLPEGNVRPHYIVTDQFHTFFLSVQLRNCKKNFVVVFYNTLNPLYPALAGAGPMQAPGLFDHPDARGKYGLVQNIGLGGAVVISLLRRPEFYRESGLDGRDRYFIISFPLYIALDIVSLCMIGWDITMPMSCDRLRVRTWIRSSRRPIRNGYFSSQNCEPCARRIDFLVLGNLNK
jgi:hypothetical protein